MISPTEARARDFYAPNSETLDPDEIRIIACGTGMPTPRPAQAAACFLMELGNGDKFIFDIGDGGTERLLPWGFQPRFWIRFFLDICTEIISATSGRCLWPAALRGVFRL